MRLGGSRLATGVGEKSALLRPFRLRSLLCFTPEQIHAERHREAVLLLRPGGVRERAGVRLGWRALDHRRHDARRRLHGQANVNRWISERHYERELRPPRAWPRILGLDPGGAVAMPLHPPDSIRPGKALPLSPPGRRRARQEQLRPHREPGCTRRAGTSNLINRRRRQIIPPETTSRRGEILFTPTTGPGPCPTCRCAAGPGNHKRRCTARVPGLGGSRPRLSPFVSDDAACCSRFLPPDSRVARPFAGAAASPEASAE
jgi:hypothetical protein